METNRQFGSPIMITDEDGNVKYQWGQPLSP
jgi:hypothetical protein